MTNINFLLLDFVVVIVGLSGVEEDDDGDEVEVDGEEEVVENDDWPKLIVSFDSISQLETTTNDIHQSNFLLFLRSTM